MSVKIVIISKSEKERFIGRLPHDIQIMFYGKTGLDLSGFMESPEGEQQIDLFILDADLSDFAEISKMVNGRIIPFNGDYSFVRSQIEPLILAKKKETGEVKEDKPPAFIVKERRIKDTVIVKQEVIHPAMVSMQRKLVLVGGCDRGSGSSFLVRNIADAVGQAGYLTSLVELPVGQPYHFDRSLLTPGILKTMSLQEEQQFQSEFLNIPLRIMENKMIAKTPYVRHGVQYIVPHPDIKLNGWTSEHTRKLMSTASNAVLTIVDVGMYWRRQAVQELFYEADEIIVMQTAETARIERVFNPKYAPSKILSFLLNLQKPLHLVFSHYADPPERNFLKDQFQFDSIREVSFMPSVPYEAAAYSAFHGEAEWRHCEELKMALQQLVGRWFSDIDLDGKPGKNKGGGISKWLSKWSQRKKTEIIEEER